MGRQPKPNADNLRSIVTSTSGGDQLLTEKQLAERWQISAKMLRNARVKGDGPAFVRVGRLIRYRVLDIEAYEAQHARRSTTASGGNHA